MAEFFLLQDFHFIRPWWLLALIPAFLFGWSLKYRERYKSSWHNFIDPALLAPLLKGKINKPGNTLPFMIILFWTLAILALAGPAWQKLPQPVKKIDNALVILLDLSPSMLAADLKPSRLVAARHKIIDLLNARQEGYTGLVAYSGDAHVVAPLTDDNETIVNLVNVLEPAIMPITGSNLEHAIQKSLQLFKNSGYTNGDILLITDGITEQAKNNSSAILSNSDYRLSIIGVGTEAGGPIPANRGGFIKDGKGNILLPSLNSALLQELASNTSGSYTPLQLGDNDIFPLIKGNHRPDQNKTTLVKRDYDQWQDMGALLTWPLLILILLAFRRGIILGYMVIIPLLYPTVTEANDEVWEKLWLNNNQRAMKAIENNDYKKAAELFDDLDWKASAQYENGEYASAAKHFKTKNSLSAYYNQGNALAKNGDFKEAINAYNEAIKLKPDFESAIYNKKIVEELLKNQEKQTSSPQENKSSDQKNEGDQQQNISPENNNNEKNQSPSNSQSQQQASENNNGEGRKKDEGTLDTSKTKSYANENNPEVESASLKTEKNDSNNEEKNAIEQWLRKVPDDPSILLRNKFEYYYQQQLEQQKTSRLPSYLNNEERW